MTGLLQGLNPYRFRRDANVNSAWWHWTVNVLAASPAIGRRGRAALLSRAGMSVGQALIEPGCYFFGSQVTLGDWAWINHRCYFDARDRIVVGESCSLAMEVMLCTSTHSFGDTSKRAGPYLSAPISIGSGTWLGTRVIVLPGVTIGPGCIIAAGAVVTTDLEPNGLYAGAPARLVRRLDADEGSTPQAFTDGSTA